MKFWLIFKTELKHVFRNKRNIVMMILFPLVLMLILGTALSGVFNSSDAFKNIDVLYFNSEPSTLSAAFQGFIKISDQIGLRFHETNSRSQGIDSIKDSKYACFIYIHSKGFELYKNDGMSFKANLVEAVLNTFLQRYQAFHAIAKLNLETAIQLVQKEPGGNLIVEKSLNQKREPRAMDYYAVTMLTLIIMYSSITGSFAIKREILAKTANRLLCSPVRNDIILTGKICGAFVATLLQVLIVFFISKYGFKAYWGEQPGVVMLLLIAEIMMAVGIGIGLAFLIRNQIALNGFLNLLIPVIVFLGGGYFSIDSAGKLILQLANLSPLRWINQALFQVIYSRDFSLVVPAVLINLGVAAIFIVLASFASRKEAFLG